MNFGSGWQRVVRGARNGNPGNESETGAGLPTAGKTSRNHLEIRLQVRVTEQHCHRSSRHGAGGER